MRALRNRQFWKQALLVLLLVALWLSAKQLPIREHAGVFAEWVRAQGAAGLAVFWIVYVCATLLFLPVSVLSLSAGAIFGPAKGLALTMVSAVTGASCAFLVARHLARAQVERKAATNERFKVIDAVIGEADWKIVLLLRLSILIPFHLSNYALGVTRIRFLPYLAASAAGMTPGTFVYVYLGHLGQTSVVQRGAIHPAQATLVGVGLLATVGVSIYLARLAGSKLRELSNKKGDPS